MASVMEWQHEGRTLEVETERIEVTTALPQPDPRWTYTDRAGHEHAYGQRGSAAHTYPTLARRESEPYWCSDCDDEHTDVWFECPLCGEQIEPGTFIDTSPQYMPGPTTYLIDGEPVTEAEGKALLDEIQTASAERQRTRSLEQARERARAAEEAMRAEGLSDQQIQRVVNRLVHGTPDGMP
ncbi:hypothetical protein [Streptomyces sp. NPDC018584]|uniref:hypothetical protein n=1 Tax=unclassified Streptomyces TaxID=2593676 RepID=UPI0037A147C5